jgi:hypothetical protein
MQFFEKILNLSNTAGLILQNNRVLTGLPRRTV